MLASVVVFVLLSAAIAGVAVYMHYRLADIESDVADVRARVLRAAASFSGLSDSLTQLKGAASELGGAACCPPTAPASASAGPPTSSDPCGGALVDAFAKLLERHQASDFVSGMVSQLMARVDAQDARMRAVDDLTARVANVEAKVAALATRIETLDVVAARSLKVRGGASDADKDGRLPTEFASQMDGRNHIRGDTEVAGDLTLSGAGSKLCVGGRCYDARQLRCALDNALAGDDYYGCGSGCRPTLDAY